ncbi:MAG: TonB family protein [Betaproteobacteria bacterium]|nr:TonB family protein [Betaproteobacteria bacterium]
MTNFTRAAARSATTRVAIPASRLLLGLAAASLLAACGKSDRVPTTAERLASVQNKQETQPDFYVPRKTVDYMTDLKSLKDAPAKPEPAPVKAEPARPVETKPAPVETKVAAAPTPAPAPVQAAPAPVQTPPPSAAAPASNVVASAAPTARPTPPPTKDVVPIISVVSRENPQFPREATRAGIEAGTVRARLTINAAGEVTNVAIVQAQPARVFDRSVQSALSRWKFNPGADNRSYETEIGFKAN